MNTGLGTEAGLQGLFFQRVQSVLMRSTLVFSRCFVRCYGLFVLYVKNRFTLLKILAPTRSLPTPYKFAGSVLDTE